MGAVTLEQIRDLDAGAAYPGYVLKGCKTALILFAAGFLGKQDAVWIADAGLTATCVDEDEAKLAEMRPLYPDGWEFVQADVYEFAGNADRQWDIVSLDPWTNQFNRCAEHVEMWCALARRGVILGTGAGTEVDTPAGWWVSEVRKRSDYDGGVYWTVLEPA